MFGIPLIEFVGYLASIIIMTSMLMSSILRLRLVNLFGSSTFAVYGFAIGALPVGILNTFIALINITYLYKAYTRKEYFKILEVRRENKYLLAFLDFYNKEIVKYFPGFKYVQGMNTITFFVLRNMAVSGIFLAREVAPNTLYIGLDFVIPEYRDFKLGNYIYNKNLNFFIGKGYNKLCTISLNQSHQKYLKKMGFHEEEINGEIHLVKHIG
jgi:hypothetical protein